MVGRRTLPMHVERTPTRSLSPVGPRHVIASRADVVERDGRLTLVNTTASPLEAMVDDLLFIRAVLDSAGISYLLIRGNDARPVLAIDAERYTDFSEAFVEAAQAEPF